MTSERTLKQNVLVDRKHVVAVVETLRIIIIVESVATLNRTAVRCLLNTHTRSIGDERKEEK